MDILIEAILEFLLEGSMEFGTDPTCPKFLRILAWIILGAVCAALLIVGGFLIYSGYQNANTAAISVGILLEAILAALVGAFFWKAHKRS